ncbi:MAG TPA: aa3-type cytochrome c oxidase subunit IV [Croceibacterium sp.]|nr:aa3-type cytochrome c oxidase subunit IV [Croceibacterium sp.]
MASANDMKAHERTYGAFIGLVKWTIPPTLLIVLVVILLIS